MSINTTRTKNTIRNISFGIACQVLNLLLTFITRSLFIYFLSIDYLGVNSLFTNVLTLLSFAELGIGNAIAYNLYRPLRDANTGKIKALMGFYRTAYFCIGAVIAVLGLSLIPFLQFLIKNPPNISDNLTLIYILFLTDTVASYYFIYKKNLIIADQKMYIVSIYTQIFNIIKVILQIIFLVFNRNYIIFLIIQILCTTSCNFFTSKMADRIYPYLKYSDQPKLPLSEKQNIFADVKAIALYKFCAAILYGMPNIIISKFIGITAVGLTSNYLLLTSGLNSIFDQLSQSMMSSIGNLNASNDAKHQKDIFDTLMFLFMFIYGYLAICLFCLANEFIKVWIGNKYVMSMFVVLAISLNFYIDKVRVVPYMYRMTLGYFIPGRYAAVASVLINMPLSIILAKLYGVQGVFLATSISTLLTFWIVDPYLIYTRKFKVRLSEFYLKSAKQTFIIFIIAIIAFFINQHIKIGGICGFMIHGFIITIIYLTVTLSVYSKSIELIEIKNRLNIDAKIAILYNHYKQHFDR